MPYVKCAFKFSLQIQPVNMSHSNKNWVSHDHKCILVIIWRAPLILSEFNKTWILSTYLRKILKYPITRKSVQWELSCFMRTNGRTDMTKLIAAFWNFANAPKNQQSFLLRREVVSPIDGLLVFRNRALTSFSSVHSLLENSTGSCEPLKMKAILSSEKSWTAWSAMQRLFPEERIPKS